MQKKLDNSIKSYCFTAADLMTVSISLKASSICLYMYIPHAFYFLCDY